LEVINLDPTHVKLAITIQNAVERAKKTKQISFIRIYPDGDNVHIGEMFGDAALEMQEWINERKKRNA
jgi:hypothetical protein